MTRLFVGTLLDPVSPTEARLIRHGGVLVGDDGRILAAGPRDELPLPPACEVIDHGNLLLTPGFVDCHCHIAQIRAVHIRQADLLTWLREVIFPIEAAYDGHVAAAEAPRFFRQLLSTGTTTAGLYVTIHEAATDAVFRVAEAVGIRAVIGKVMMDRHAPPALLEDTMASLDAAVRLAEKWHNAAAGRLRYAFTPRFALTCSPELMAEAGRAAAAFDAHVMTHVAENRAEVARAAELFPEARSYLDVYVRAGLVRRGTVLGHAIYLDDEDWRTVAALGAGVAHCPSSNLLLESGILDLSKPLAHAIPVGLGSDIGAGSDPAVVEVAETAIDSQIARKVLGHSHHLIGPELAFFLMTQGGADAMGLGDRIGSLAPGKEADLLAIDPREVLPLGEWDPDLAPGALLYALLLRFRAAAIRSVYVHGRQVFDRGARD